MAPSIHPWRNLLTRDRFACTLCKGEHPWTGLDGILPPGVDIDTFGRRRYWAELKRRFMAHIDDTHQDWRAKIV